MDILTGDETGLLKFVAARSKAGIHSYGQQSRAAAIKGLCWLDYENKQFASFRSNGILDSWKMNGGEVLHQNSVHISNIKDPAGVVHLRNKVGSRDPLICYGAEGDICLVQVENSDEASNGDLVFDELSTLQLKGPLSTCEPFTNGLACGGKENDVVLYSLETQQVEWTAKNVPHDYLKLRVPIWIRGISFLRPHPQNTSSDALFATGTGYRHVRIYDTKTSRQPVTSIDIGEYPVTAIAAMPSSGDANSEALYVADASGGLSIWDLRMMRRQLTLKGSSGSIRCLNISNSGNDNEHDYISA
jgi:ribosome biogenesis protein NSA1